jgi:hypothetical protein
MPRLTRPMAEHPKGANTPPPPATSLTPKAFPNSLCVAATPIEVLVTHNDAVPEYLARIVRFGAVRRRAIAPAAGPPSTNEAKPWPEAGRDAYRVRLQPRRLGVAARDQRATGAPRLNVPFVGNVPPRGVIHNPASPHPRQDNRPQRVVPLTTIGRFAREPGWRADRLLRSGAARDTQVERGPRGRRGGGERAR